VPGNAALNDASVGTTDATLRIREARTRRVIEEVERAQPALKTYVRGAKQSPILLRAGQPHAATVGFPDGKASHILAWRRAVGDPVGEGSNTPSRARRDRCIRSWDPHAGKIRADAGGRRGSRRAEFSSRGELPRRQGGRRRLVAWLKQTPGQDHALRLTDFTGPTQQAQRARPGRS